MSTQESLAKKAALMRKWSLISTTDAGSGHPTTCLSAVDLMTVFFDKFYTFDLKDKHNLANDRLIFSKGHAAPLLYALYAGCGLYPFEELHTLRVFGSIFEGHPVPEFPYTEAATGSLGQGLSIAAGMAFGLKNVHGIKRQPKVYVLVGDGELAEGQVWEAANFASYYKLNNLIAIADINRLGQSQETMLGHRLDEYEKRFSAFGWEVLTIDGHDFKAIEKAYTRALKNKTNRPFIILAKTIKGKGVSFWEDKNGYHSKPLSKEDLIKAIEGLDPVEEKKVFTLQTPKEKKYLSKTPHTSVETTYKKGDIFMTKEVVGRALIKLAKKNKYILALDGDVKNSTSVIEFEKEYPGQFLQCFIAEQNMIGVATGLSKLGFFPYCATFSAFFTRAFDQIRMARVSQATLRLTGSYSGVSLGKDGSSQMGLEDMAMIGVLPDSVILYPADSVATEKLVGLQMETEGISYLRTSRPKVPVIYNNDEKFTLGGSKVLRSSKKDVLTVIGAGITVYEALKAYDTLQKEGISIRVVDCYSVKPIDRKTLLTCAKETKKHILITVEDHFAHGGLGDFVLDAVGENAIPVYKMAVTHISHSGEEPDVIADAGISAKDIVAKVKSLLA